MPNKKKAEAAAASSLLRSEKRQAAIDEYEKGIRLLQQKDYSKAAPRFEAILKEHPEETALSDRARAYLTIANRELEKRAPLRSTREPELSYEVGVFLLNDGEPKEALRHLERAAEHAPKDATVQVCLAAAHAALGDHASSFACLRKAVDMDPSTRFRVRNMADFSALAGREEFRAIVQGE